MKTQTENTGIKTSYELWNSAIAGTGTNFGISGLLATAKIDCDALMMANRGAIEGMRRMNTERATWLADFLTTILDKAQAQHVRIQRETECKRVAVLLSNITLADV